MNATLSIGQMAVLIAARRIDDESRSLIKTQVFTAAKAQYGIPDDHKLTVEIDNPRLANYGVLIRKKGQTPYTLNAAGKAVDFVPAAAVIPPVKRWFAVDLGDIQLSEAVDDVLANTGFDGGISEANDLGQYPAKTSTDDYRFKVVDGDIYVQLEESDF